MDPGKKQTAGPSTPKVFADGNSVVTNRKVTDVKGNHLNMVTEIERHPGSGPTGNAVGEFPRADYIATGGSVICSDVLSHANINGDLNFNLTIKQSQVPAGRGDKTPPSSQGPAVEIIIHHKVELIECLRADPSFILQHVHAKRMVTDGQYQRLKHISQPEERVTELIDQVIGGGQESCSRFLTVLKKPDILQTYPQLKKMVLV
ncbi:hypothetical protein EPR50_G00120840 [Perca flavescens]|uniref:CARD domain-containing protein n=1 Tax=Perca flavescens TaxID=8167 RepID=A0A484CW66_PERFV|nr:uncharacterized protein LOC114563578 isoform X3 [Perca flavescens]XP_028446183.1 uncharacterized protein LOC114563578 isoform X3 [Perca flavescens]TDH07161.1 hypothetical protein EPR50_G00120840 [Perca flavescens]